MHLLVQPMGEGRMALFGAGLIGSALLTRARELGAAASASMAWDWSADAARRQCLIAEAARRLAGTDRLDLIWSAGRAGFGADARACEHELANFAAIVELCDRLRTNRPQRLVLLHLVSSAGGVYEGSGEVGPGTPVAPLRPYGELKLAQEKLACSRLGKDGVAIYRPSAVFGWTRHGRRGLIMTLLANGLVYQVTTIVGRADSTRDFLWVRDLADWMMRGLRDPVRPGRCWVLAAGRSRSLAEVSHAVEQTLGRRLYVQYRIDPREPRRLAYHPAIIAPGLHSNELSVALRRMWVEAAGSAPSRAGCSSAP
jgi:UDP-glucose 4-epimerase